MPSTRRRQGAVAFQDGGEWTASGLRERHSSSPEPRRHLYAVEAATAGSGGGSRSGPSCRIHGVGDFYLSARRSPVRGSCRVRKRRGPRGGAGNGKVVWRTQNGGRVRSSRPSPTAWCTSAASTATCMRSTPRRGAARKLRAGRLGRPEGGRLRPAVRAELAGRRRRPRGRGSRDGSLRGGSLDGEGRWNFDHQIRGRQLARDRGGRAILGSSDAGSSTRWSWRRVRKPGGAARSPTRCRPTAVAGETWCGRCGREHPASTSPKAGALARGNGEAVPPRLSLREGKVFVGSEDGKLYALSGDLKAEPRRAIRAVVLRRARPYRGFEGDKALRDALVAES